MGNSKANRKKDPFRAQKKAIAVKYFGTKPKMDTGPTLELTGGGSDEHQSSDSSDSEYYTDSSDTIQKFWKTKDPNIEMVKPPKQVPMVLKKPVTGKEMQLSAPITLDKKNVSNTMDIQLVDIPSALKTNQTGSKQQALPSKKRPKVSISPTSLLLASQPAVIQSSSSSENDDPNLTQCTMAPEVSNRNRFPTAPLGIIPGPETSGIMTGTPQASEEGWTKVGRKNITCSSGAAKQATSTKDQACQPPPSSPVPPKTNLPSTDPPKQGSRVSSCPKPPLGGQHVVTVPRIEDKLPTSFEVSQFPARLKVYAPLNQPGNESSAQDPVPTSISQAASQFYADVASVCQVTSGKIAAIFKFPRWEYNRSQAHRAFTTSVRHDCLVEAIAILKTLVESETCNLEEQWIINETLPNSLPLERSLRISLMPDEMAPLDSTDYPIILAQMHRYWIQRGATAVKLQKHRPKFPANYERMVPQETAHLVIIFPHHSSVFMALCMEIDAKEGLIYCPAAPEGRRNWFSTPHSIRASRQPRPTPCKNCLLTDHHADLCPGIKRCNISLRPLLDNEARIAFLGSVSDLLRLQEGAPTVEIVTDDQGNLRDLCRLNFTSVEKTTEALQNNLMFTTTDHEGNHVMLKTFPVTGCPRCLLDTHRGSPCPTPKAQDPPSRSGHSSLPQRRSHLPRSTHWGIPKDNLVSNASETRSGAHPSTKEREPPLSRAKNATTTPKFSHPNSSRSTALAQDRQKRTQLEGYTQRNQTEPSAPRSPTQKVNILDYLKPTSRNKKGTPIAQDLYQETSSLIPPLSMEDTPNTIQDAASFRPRIDDQMDESTGVDQAEMETNAAQQQGIPEPSKTSEAASVDAEQLNVPLMTLETNQASCDDIARKANTQNQNLTSSHYYPEISSCLSAPEAERHHPLTHSC
jgi:hypothetical protein